jgi:hypothetical protein
MVSAFGIIVCLVTSLVAYSSKAKTFAGVSSILKN